MASQCVSSHRQSENLIAYLVDELAPAHIERLYDEQPYTCLAVFRSLPDLEKQYVYRLLYCGGVSDAGMNGNNDVNNKNDKVNKRFKDSSSASTPIEIVSSFIKEKHGSRHRAALDVLSRLRVLVRGAGVYTMHGGFRRHLQGALSCGVGNWLREGREGTDGTDGAEGGGSWKIPEQEVIDAYAWGQWEKVLMFAIGDDTEEGAGGLALTVKGSKNNGSSLDLQSMMVSAGLIREDTDGSTGKAVVNITERGFQFLLADTHTQVWVVLKEYIKHASTERSREVFDALIEFMLRLGFQKGERVEVGGTAQGKEICADLCALGLLYPLSAKEMVPTKLAVILSSATADTQTPASSVIEEDGFVIVETNYRVYAYTSSPLKQAILRLFVRAEVLLANLLVGSITRESVMSALDSGITSEQIIGYLTQHAHKRVLGRSPVVPTVVMDSIRLWQQELRRMQMEEAVLYKNFESPALYKQVKAFIEGIGADLSVNDARKEVVALGTAHERIKDKIKELKEQMMG